MFSIHVAHHLCGDSGHAALHHVGALLVASTVRTTVLANVIGRGGSGLGSLTAVSTVVVVAVVVDRGGGGGGLSSVAIVATLVSIVVDRGGLGWGRRSDVSVVVSVVIAVATVVVRGGGGLLLVIVARGGGRLGGSGGCLLAVVSVARAVVTIARRSRGGGGLGWHRAGLLAVVTIAWAVVAVARSRSSSGLGWDGRRLLAVVTVARSRGGGLLLLVLVAWGGGWLVDGGGVELGGDWVAGVSWVVGLLGGWSSRLLVAVVVLGGSLGNWLVLTLGWGFGRSLLGKLVGASVWLVALGDGDHLGGDVVDALVVGRLAWGWGALGLVDGDDLGRDGVNTWLLVDFDLILGLAVVHDLPLLGPLAALVLLLGDRLLVIALLAETRAGVADEDVLAALSVLAKNDLLVQLVPDAGIVLVAVVVRRSGDSTIPAGGRSGSVGDGLLLLVDGDVVLDVGDGDDLLVVVGDNGGDVLIILPLVAALAIVTLGDASRVGLVLLGDGDRRLAIAGNDGGVAVAANDSGARSGLGSRDRALHRGDWVATRSGRRLGRSRARPVTISAVVVVRRGRGRNLSGNGARLLSTVSAVGIVGSRGGGEEDGVLHDVVGTVRMMDVN